jgi:hypothetical protein
MRTLRRLLIALVACAGLLLAGGPLTASAATAIEYGLIN